MVFYGPGSGSDVRWHGRPDRTFEASVEIDISGVYTPLPGDFAGTDRGDIVFWDEDAHQRHPVVELTHDHGLGLRHSHVRNM